MMISAALVPEVNRGRLSILPLIMLNPVAFPGLLAQALPLVPPGSGWAAPHAFSAPSMASAAIRQVLWHGFSHQPDWRAPLPISMT